MEGRGAGGILRGKRFYMHEKLVIVPRKKSTVKKILNVVWFVQACLCLLFAMRVPILFAVPAIIFAIIW